MRRKEDGYAVTARVGKKKRGPSLCAQQRTQKKRTRVDNVQRQNEMRKSNLTRKNICWDTATELKQRIHILQNVNRHF